MAEVVGSSVDGYGVKGSSTNGVGVVGDTASQFAAVWGHGIGKGPGLLGSSYQGYGVLGKSTLGHGVVGETNSRDGMAVWGTNQYGSSHTPAVVGNHYGRGPAVHGHSSYGYGVEGISGLRGPGVVGQCSVRPENVVGAHRNAAGVRGSNYARNGVGVWGEAADMYSAAGESSGGWGVVGYSRNGTGVEAISESGTALVVRGSTWFSERVRVLGDLEVMNGDKPFKIDHPIDPQNKYLLHNPIESPERKNVYDGVAELDEDGEAWVDLPEWFEALNGGFRYQLTAVGQAAPNLHVAEEIYENRFKVAGGEEGMKVCWQVTGSRKDRWAAANRFDVEQEKPEEERGRYLDPSLYNAPEEQSIMMARLGEERLRPMMREESPGFEPPQAEPPEAPEMPPPGFDLVRQHEEHRQQIEELNRSRLEEEQQRQIDELREQIEEQKRGRLEEEIDDLRRQIKKLKRQR